MDGAGMSVGGVGGIGWSGGGMQAPAAAGAQAANIFFAGRPAPNNADFVVSISHAAMRALALDVATAVDGSSTAHLANDLAALALLAILERDRQNSSALVTATAAIGAYLAVQALVSG